MTLTGSYYFMTFSLLARRKLVPPPGAGMRMTELSHGIGGAQASVWLLCDSPGAGNCCWHGCLHRCSAPPAPRDLPVSATALASLLQMATPHREVKAAVNEELRSLPIKKLQLQKSPF